MPNSRVTDREAALALHDVSRVFRTGDITVQALSGISLTVQRGDFLSIQGPSGCGKSTLLSIMGLIEASTSGRIALDGVDCTSASAYARARLRREKIGFVFQNFNLLDELTLAENVALPLKYNGVGRAERQHRAREALARVGLSPRADARPSQVSGGQQQRAAVARAIVGRPSVLLADEPTGNLDSANGSAIMELLAGLHAGGTTIVLVTHDARYHALATRAIRIEDGRVVRDG
ncbi:MAG: ABC transporter ATP-binding protein [Gemmatimonadota bacterium]|jgi:putative ABC transport system ATP-binding protein